jgi:signal transduction histidine kinase
VKQPARLPEVPPAVQSLALDPARLEQFLDLQRGVLAIGADPRSLPGRLVQGAAVFLGTGAAVGVVQDGLYRLLATYGVGADYAKRYDGVSLRDPTLFPALTGGRPLVLAERDAGSGPRATILLPFHAAEIAGALHLVPSPGEMLPEPELELARAITVLAGLALGNARQCERLAQVARLKGDALSAMAHDLRAPLNALVGYAGLLGEGAFGPLTPEQREVSATLERQALELVDLLGATLDVARLETGQLPLRVEEFALADVLGALRAGTFAHASRQGLLAIRVAADLPALSTDRVKVKEIVQNLVDNALKHSGSTVEVEAALAPDREAVRITVRDAGPGIATEVLPHLFEPFRAGSARGTGFGLYLVRSFAEALGGRIAARSLPGEGTAVTVELPLTAPAHT